MLERKESAFRRYTSFFTNFPLDRIQVSDKSFARKLKSSKASTVALYFSIFEGVN